MADVVAESPHRAVRMSGRDPHERARASTPLELLFDLTFVIAFGTAADELARLLAEDHVTDAIVGFAFATFAISWAWFNFTWFASAYDTDDWIFRLTTMVQMAGVIVLALGLPRFFESLVEGERFDNGVMVLGYVVMRVPMIAQWLRVTKQDPERADTARLMATTLALAQVGWVVLALVSPSLGTGFACALGLIAVEVWGPVVGERHRSATPWHAHHIAERFGLMVIIALGEGLLGTTAALAALVDEGWTVEVGLLGGAGVALVFGIWWSYFVLPNGALLHAHRERSFLWGYGHMPLFGAVVAVGAGLHLASYSLAGDSELGILGTVLAVGVPLSVYLLSIYLLYAQLSHSVDPWHLPMIVVSTAVILAAIALAAGGADLVVCLLVLSAAPWVTVVGYELVGHRHAEAHVAG